MNKPNALIVSTALTALVVFTGQQAATQGHRFERLLTPELESEVRRVTTRTVPTFERGLSSAEKAAVVSDLDQRYKAELEKWESEKPAVADVIKQLKASAEELRESIPRGVLVLFDRLYDRSGGAAMARVRRIKASKGSANAMWHCEACSYNVRPQVMVEIRDRGSLNQCDSCKRILYWEDED